MKDKKLKSLDIIRMIISIFVLLSALYVIFSPFIAILLAGEEDDLSGLIFIFSLLGYFCAVPGVLGFIRFFVTRKKVVSKRRFSVLGLLTIIGLFLMALLIPINIINVIESEVEFYILRCLRYLPAIVYLTCEIIERVVVKNIAKKELNNSNMNNENTTINEATATSTAQGKLYCAYCGKLGIDESSNYCQHCGKKTK